jgi:hypothetical protein
MKKKSKIFFEEEMIVDSLTRDKPLFFEFCGYSFENFN